ncbi:hypothetical protein G4952_07670 [Blautia wexlerae]|uniref:NADP-dependent oxidoreductase domain-containing protein n=2 Tax=Blautia wexlerae TaxID=418240 RepID=A0ABX2GNC8_9FIRM|nr:hypothetical protein [Blautia wexlerae]
MTGPNPDMHKSRVSESCLKYDLEESLRVLGTDYIDIYFYHRDNEDVPVSELIDIMEDFRKQGKIRYYACSNWTTARMKEADAYAAACNGFFHKLLADCPDFSVARHYIKNIRSSPILHRLRLWCIINR